MRVFRPRQLIIKKALPNWSSDLSSADFHFFVTRPIHTYFSIFLYNHIVIGYNSIVHNLIYLEMRRP